MARASTRAAPSWLVCTGGGPKSSPLAPFIPVRKRVDPSPASAHCPPVPAPQSVPDLFLARPAGPPLVAECQKLLNYWAAGIPFSPIKNFTNETRFLRADELAVYQITVDTQIERRWLEDHEVPYRGQTLPATPRSRDSFDPWSLTFVRHADFQPHRSSQDLTETRRAYSCGSCRATGRVRCDKCAGRGRVHCSSCGGSGSNRCFSCSGSGHLSRHRTASRMVNCTSCAGSGRSGGGRSSCLGCNGRGMRLQEFQEEYFVPCGNCASSGQVRCSGCGGSGEVTCSRCSGCGQVTCPRCQGVGRLLAYSSCEQEEKPLRGHRKALPQFPTFSKAASPISDLSGPVVFTQDERQVIRAFGFSGQPAAQALTAAVGACRQDHTGTTLRQRITVTRCSIVQWHYSHREKAFSLFLNPAHRLLEDTSGPIFAEISRMDQLAEEACKRGDLEEAFRLNQKALCMDEASPAEKALRRRIFQTLYRDYALGAGGTLLFLIATYYALVGPPDPALFFGGLLTLLLGLWLLAYDVGLTFEGRRERLGVAVAAGGLTFLASVPARLGTNAGWGLNAFFLVTLAALALSRQAERRRRNAIETRRGEFPGVRELEAYVATLRPDPALAKRILGGLAAGIALLTLLHAFAFWRSPF